MNPIFEAITINYFGIKQHLLIYEPTFQNNYKIRLWNCNSTKCYCDALPLEKLITALKANYKIEKIIISNEIFCN